MPVKIDVIHAIAHNKIMIIDGETVITGSFNFTKAAEVWFDAYWQEPNPDYIDKYWLGACKYTNRQTWEYLVDGMIETNDPEGMEHLRKHGVNIAPRRA